MSKKEINSREDLELLVNEFYVKVRKDDVLSYIFNEAIDLDWSTHIPIIVDFWESMILDNPIYKRNAMHAHINLSQHVVLESKHFERWKYLFYQTLDEYFTGPDLEGLKKRIDGIATLMEFKVNNSGNLI